MSTKRITLQIITTVNAPLPHCLMAYGSVMGKGKRLLVSEDKLDVIDFQDTVACKFAKRGYFVESAKDLVKVI